jgi:hypothetical protein
MKVYIGRTLGEFYPERRDQIATLYKEGNELVAMIVSSINTAVNGSKANLQSPI